jgi:hypothetical protein
MVSISVQKVQALIQSLERLYSAETLKQFPSTVFSALSEIIEGSVFSLNTVNLKTGEVISETSHNVVLSPEIKNRIVKLAPTNAAVALVRAGAKGATRLADCTAQSQFEQGPIYLMSLYRLVYDIKKWLPWTSLVMSRASL